MTDAPRVTSARPNAGASGPAPKGSKKARREAAAAPVKKPTPWGSIALFTALALFAGGVITFAALNAGSARLDPEEITVAGIETYEDLSRGHVDTEVTYEQRPPAGGDHDATPQDCQGRVYTSPIRDENAVHSLEHGAVWVTHQPDLAEDQVETLSRLVEGENYRMMSPYPDQESPVVLTAWGIQLAVDSADDERVEQFLKKYTSGEQTPEPGASCAGVAMTES